MARRKLIAGNWKMNGLRADGLALAADVASRIKAVSPTRYDMLVCPPFTLIPEVVGRRRRQRRRCRRPGLPHAAEGRAYRRHQRLRC